MKPWLVFAFSAALFWGAYVPAIAQGQGAFTGPNKSLRAFLFVGVAYFLMAVLVPTIMLIANPDDSGFTAKGIGISTLAGAFGAAGALCVIFALRTGGISLTVAPIVFAVAPLVNVLISYVLDLIAGKAQTPHWPFFIGIVLAALGVYLILAYNPAAHAPPKPVTAAAVNPAKGAP